MPVMTSTQDWTWNSLAALVFCLAISAAGCSAIDSGDSGVMELPGKASVMDAQTPQPVGSSITVEMRQAGKEPEMRQMPLMGVLHVQEALEEVGAVKRFRRMDVRVMRLARDQRQKLEVRYDHRRRSVEPLYDYALHPGDHLVVMEDTTTAMDDMLQSVTGSIGLPTRQ